MVSLRIDNNSYMISIADKLLLRGLILIITIMSVQCSTTEAEEFEDIIEKEEPKEPEVPVNKITIDISKKLHPIPENSGGVVSCWLMDSDIERPRKTSFANAMKEMGVKYIRFPYGHLADNYLWDADGDWGNTLTPKVATSAQAPAAWDWAVDPATGEFKKDMDFDEYISICKEVGAEPMVVVNILSYKYNNGPTYAQLKETAVEWVRYANITKGYGVKRWAIGNEIDHHSDLISQDEYKALYSDFALAMKAVDPQIMVGPGLLGNWHAALLNHDPENIDFICAHNYLYKYDWRNNDYKGWKNATDILVNNVEKCQNAVNNSSIPDIEIHVTEMNSRPWSNKSDSDDLFRALCYGEMLLNSLTFEDVRATYVWNTHGPWGGEEENAAYNILDMDNNREPRGDIIKLLNENLKGELIDAPRIKGYLRTYGCVDEENKNLKIVVLNKNDKPERVELTLSGSQVKTDGSVQSYSGSGPNDELTTLSDLSQVELVNGVLTSDLPAVSLNVFTIKLK